MIREQIRQAINNKQYIVWEIAGGNYIGIPKRIKGNMIDMEWHLSPHLVFINNRTNVSRYIKTINAGEFYNWIFEHTNIEKDTYSVIRY